MIDGVKLVALKQIEDDRGAVLHMLRSDAPEFREFGECYFSEVNPGAVKAWKRHDRQTQMLAVPVGHIRIVIYDDRENSVTHGQVQRIDLGRPHHYFRLQIPPKLWYGFTCYGSNPALIVNCVDMPHCPSESEMIPVQDSQIPYDWCDESEALHAR